MRLLIISLLAGFFLLLGLNKTRAQGTEYLLEDIRLSGIYGGPLFNFTYYDGEPQRIFGGYFAFGFDRTIAIGWQWMRMRDRVLFPDQVDEWRINYNGFTVDFTPWGGKIIHPEISFLVGPGDYFLGSIKKRVLVLQPSAGLEVNIWRIMKVGVQGGYRFIQRNDPNLVPTEDINTFFLQVDLRFGWSW
jgi:hypothetical protein